MADEQVVYILDTIDKYSNDDVVQIFCINGIWYGIKRVKLFFGKPILSSIEKNEDESIRFRLYDTLEEAKEVVAKLKRAGGEKIL